MSALVWRASVCGHVEDCQPDSYEAGDSEPCVYCGDRKCVATVEQRKETTMTNEDIAKVCHEANRAYCQTIGDNSQPAWESAPEWQRQSAINGVAFTAANPSAPPSASHDSWLEEKRVHGWKFGPVKNPDAKEHPCFVPYEQLPVEQRLKDALFQHVARALLGPAH